MRTKARLIEVLLSIPENSVDQCLLRDAAKALERGILVGFFVMQRLRNVRRISESPHYRELAQEALHYIEESAKNG